MKAKHQMAVLSPDCRAVADSKYNIAELLEFYVPDEIGVGQTERNEQSEWGGMDQTIRGTLSGKERARNLYLECEQIYCKLYGPDNDEVLEAASCAARCDQTSSKQQRE